MPRNNHTVTIPFLKDLLSALYCNETHNKRCRFLYSDTWTNHGRCILFNISLKIGMASTVNSNTSFLKCKMCKEACSPPKLNINEVAIVNSTSYESYSEEYDRLYGGEES